MISLRTRKPVDKLTPADFDAFPIWEYALDEEADEDQDETWVRPVGRQHVPAGEYSQLVSAQFTTAAGKVRRGFMIVTTARVPIEITPGALVGSRLYAVLPNMTRAQAKAVKTPWSIQSRDALVRKLRVSEDALFPMSYALDVLIGREKEKRTGVIR